MRNVIYRRYEIGNNITVSDDGYSLCFEQKNDDRSSSSIGSERPDTTPVPKAGDKIKVKYSVGRQYFYLPGYATPHGYWLSTKAYPDQASCEADQKAGIFGKNGVEFTKPRSGEKWCRAKLDFTYWKVDSEPEAEDRVVDDMVIDYLHLSFNDRNEHEQRINGWLKERGSDKTLAWIAEKIGPWVAPSEIPTVTLK